MNNLDEDLTAIIAHQAEVIDDLGKDNDYLRDCKEALFIALDTGLKGIFPPLDTDPDDSRVQTSARNYRYLKTMRDLFKPRAKHKAEEAKK